MTNKTALSVICSYKGWFDYFLKNCPKPDKKLYKLDINSLLTYHIILIYNILTNFKNGIIFEVYTEKS
jgi:hypothetical protein